MTRSTMTSTIAAAMPPPPPTASDIAAALSALRSLPPRAGLEEVLEWIKKGREDERARWKEELAEARRAGAAAVREETGQT